MKLIRKSDETIFKSIMTREKIWAHKWKDVMICPSCHYTIYVTDRDQAVKGESIVDYLIFNSHNVPAWVECKSFTAPRLSLDKFSDNQINFLNSWAIERKAPVFLFLVAADESHIIQHIYLIPWVVFNNFLAINNKSSVRFDKIVDYFPNYELVYVTKKGYDIPIYLKEWYSWLDSTIQGA